MDEQIEIKIERGKRGAFKVTVRTSSGYRAISRGHTADSARTYADRMLSAFFAKAEAE